MKYSMYTLTFPNGIHIGNGKLSASDTTIHADTIFSAMCIEALNIGGEKMLSELVTFSKEGRLLVSDALPYISDTLYIPKPMYRITDKEQDISKKKEFKKLEYIPYTELDNYMCGKLEPNKINFEFSKLGLREIHQKVFIKYDDDNELYSVGAYKFNEDCGLYIIIGSESTEQENLTDAIFESLQYSGLGGKRSAGYGRFYCKKSDVPFENMLRSNAGLYMTLSVCMASDDELEKALCGASYKMIKRSGFVQSATYSDEQVKKRDFYMFSTGSVFKERFCGDIFDVSIKGKHPVYKYAKPVLMGIGGER